MCSFFMFNKSRADNVAKVAKVTIDDIIVGKSESETIQDAYVTGMLLFGGYVAGLTVTCLLPFPGAVVVGTVVGYKVADKLLDNRGRIKKYMTR